MAITVSVKKKHLALPEGSDYQVEPPTVVHLKKQTRKAAADIPIPNTQVLKKSNERRKKASEIKQEIAKLRRYVRGRCNELAEIYDLKPRYFADMFYQGGVRNAKARNAPNPFNAFKSVMAHERRKAGEKPLHLVELQAVLEDEYNTLDEKEKAGYIEKYLDLCDKDKREKIKRPSMKAKSAECMKTVKEILGKAMTLKTSVGVEMIGLVVKNRSEPYLEAQWIATDPRLHDYLNYLFHAWDPVEVGKKVEAFAVAGCDVIKTIKNQKDQVDTLKKDIVRLVQKDLDEACGTENLTMQYERFDTLITMPYKVTLEGWPKGIKCQSPHSFGGALAPLMTLHDAWRNGTTYFRKMDDTEFEAWKAKRAEKVESGEIVPKARKKRSDAGVSRKNKGKDQELEKASDEPSESEGTEVKGTKAAKKADPKAKAEITSKPTKRSQKFQKEVVPDEPRSDSTDRNTSKRKITKPKDSTSAQPNDTPDVNATTGSGSGTATKSDRPRPQPRRIVPQSKTQPTPMQAAPETADNAGAGGYSEGADAGTARMSVDPPDPSPTLVPVADKPATPINIPRAPSDDLGDSPHAPFDERLIDPQLREPSEETSTSSIQQSSESLDAPPNRPPDSNTESLSSEGRKRKRTETEILQADLNVGPAPKDSKRQRIPSRKTHFGDPTAPDWQAPETFELL
ncbi:hypothetical protein V5O48_018260 [Marasmius crinis-equi]|uniref:Uncharacterized protein n=1 Tax=Marasmius crinis-equi TaxID=585013 RepID=A0ABR3ELP7_9AGAR